VKLDEWGGIAMDDPGSCEGQLLKYLVNPLGLSMDRYFGFKSNPTDPDAECKRIRSRLAAEGPIDLCVLGLGMNGPR
jgi:galactosamine-6-phosphate isomerase